MEEVKVVIVDDHQMFIDGIKALLRNEKRINFIKEAVSAEEALVYLSGQQPDILITDISMPGMSGTELTKRVKELYPEIKVLVLTMYNDPSIVNEILQAEAEGYILKNTGKQELVSAINKIIDNGTFYSNEVLNNILKFNSQRTRTKSGPQTELTVREIEILKLICEEYTTASIAEKLFISPRTVDTHRKNILEKTGVKTIVGLIKYAFENKIYSI